MSQGHWTYTCTGQSSAYTPMGIPLMQDRVRTPSRPMNTPLTQDRILPLGNWTYPRRRAEFFLQDTGHTPEAGHFPPGYWTYP
ncbi:hypothetical protein TNCV_4396381 [Trichonephila clavipes]|uniref:Uncharacterized protein n=1 Tax=Trichonephila clavipes TaxID=2585209 RepID=A0A8X7BE74_TRICX|nr:hypothetical protein TNCV_4396381 [Trichonephila clavipes]